MAADRYDLTNHRPLGLLGVGDTALGRNRFVQTSFRFYHETGFGLVVQIKWTV